VTEAVLLRIQWLMQIGLTRNKISRLGLDREMTDLAFRAAVKDALKRRMPKEGFNGLSEARERD